MMQIHGYPPNLVVEVQSIIDQANKGQVPVNTALEDIWQKLSDLKITRTMTMMVDNVMCHPCNRGKLGLNGHNVHRNIHHVDNAGVDLNELGKSNCFELCPLEPTKSKQIAWNARLVKSANGLLADLNGSETVMSVGTGHFTAGCRAVKSGCRTPFPDLADAKGNLAQDRFRKKDHRWSVCFDKGWMWRVWPWQAEYAWPMLPDLAQRGLNSSHGVTSRSTELEVMVWVFEACKDAQGTQFTELLEAVKLSGPVCAQYITAVGKLAMQIGGGAKGSVLFFMDRFAKSFGENKILGQEFVEAVVSLNLSKTNSCNYVRTALVITNLISEKVVDGVAKLLTPSDVNRLNGLAKKSMAIGLNEFIKHAWAICESAWDAGYISEQSFDETCGRMMVRAILFCVDKQKLAPAGMTIGATIDDIKCAFRDDILETATGAPVDFGEMTFVEKRDEKDEKDKDTKEKSKTNLVSDEVLMHMLSDDQQNDPVVVCKRHGFQIKDYVKEKGVEDGGVFRIAAIGAVVELDSVDVFEGERFWNTPLEKFLDDWTKFNGKITTLLKVPQTGFPAFVDGDNAKCTAFQTLLEFEKAQTRDLQFAMNPSIVATNQAVPKNALRLAPFTMLSSMNVDSKKKSSLVINVGGVMVYPSAPNKPDKNEELDKYMFTPFWWVTKTSDPELANMAFASHKIGKVSFPILHNTHALHPNQRLYLYKENAVKMAMSNAIEKEDVGDGKEAEGAKGGTKRTRTSGGSAQQRKKSGAGASTGK